MRAYWVSEKWREAWALTAVIIGITALASKTSVWMAEASAELVNGIAFFHHPDNATPLQTVLTSAGLLMMLVLFKDLGLIGTRHLFSTTLHRKWRGWLDERFNKALLDRNHTHFHIQHATRAANGSPVPTPDNIEQRIQESIKGMTGGAIGLAMGVIGVFTSLWFVGEKLIETSGPVSGLDFLGSYGSAVLALTAVVLYVPLNTYIAVKVGRALQRLTNTMQQAEGSYRGELTTFLRRSFHVAATRGEAVQKAMHDRLYSDVDRTWSRLNWYNAGYMSFELIYNFMAARIVSYAPGLVPYMNEKVSLKGYITGAELVNSLISQCSWFIHVMPEIATLRTNARRVTELAEAIERVQRPDDFYRQTGHSDFRFGTQNSVFGLTIKNLELMHVGEDAQAFLSAPHLRFRRGEWTFVKGESGSGKTSLIKAINGLWPYGGGEITLPEGATTFYATQDVRLPPVSLKQLVCLPAHEDEHSDTKVAALLHKAGLGEFIEFLLEPSRDGKIWEEVLSGGQKQKLVLARILLHQPALLFLDEATSALDVEAKAAFHQALKDAGPAITVISIMHEAEPPKSASGEDFYDSVLRITDGVATKRPLRAGLPAELTTILEKPVPAAPRSKHVSQRQHLRQKQE